MPGQLSLANTIHENPLKIMTATQGSKLQWLDSACNKPAPCAPHRKQRLLPVRVRGAAAPLVLQGHGNDAAACKLLLRPPGAPGIVQHMKGQVIFGNTQGLTIWHCVCTASSAVKRWCRWCRTLLDHCQLAGRAGGRWALSSVEWNRLHWDSVQLSLSPTSSRPVGTHPTTLGEATNQAGLPYALTPW